ncbi:MAG TPA: ATP-binding protein [Kofleriaceae bacterium]|nr:ATP-binding protein [Kofleriaceae bacterium]
MKLPWLPRKVDAIVGMRRAGKTWLMFQRMRELVEAGTPREDLLYINFEDERLGEVTSAHLSKIVEAHYRRNPEGRSRPGALFFDEIQLVDGWERFVRRLVDTGAAHVCVTGSSAKLLSREIATSLRGRSLATELFPFGLVEVLEHRGIEVEPRPAANVRSTIEHAASEYLRRGGFPEVQLLDEPTRVRVLQSYLDVAILRDLIERHQIANSVALRRFVRQLMNAPASLFSVHKLYDDLKSQGLTVSKDSLHAWLDHIQDAFVFFAVPIHTSSERARQVNPRKMYAVDPGLVTACARRGSADVGHLLEIAVFVELRRMTPELSYARTASGYEVDFVTPSGLVQACASIDDPATREREVRALREAMSTLGYEDATIVTLTTDEEIRVDEGTIRVVPLWRWAIERAAP